MDTILELKDIVMKYTFCGFNVDVLNDVNLLVKQGESVALIGQSGSGKSTLLQISALLEKPTSGQVFINDNNVTNLPDEGRTKLRRDNLGFVYQFHNLLPEFTALENVMMPQLIQNVSKKDAELRSKKLLNDVGLSHRLQHCPKMLSGGEQQRVAIARALSNNPKIIIADEPTGNLDPKNAEIIFNIFINLIKNSKTALLMATHNIEIANALDRTITISSINTRNVKYC